MPPKRRRTDDENILEKEKNQVPLSIRNRLAQKAFRERKSAYIKELEEKVYKADGDRLEHLRLLQSRAQKLVTENESLKQALMELGREADGLRWENTKLKSIVKDTAWEHMNPPVPPFFSSLPPPILSSSLLLPEPDCIPFNCDDLSSQTNLNTYTTFKQSEPPPKDGNIPPLSINSSSCSPSGSCKPKLYSVSISSCPTSSSSTSCSSASCGSEESKNLLSSIMSGSMSPGLPLRSPSTSATDFSVELSPVLSADDFPEARFAPSPIPHACTEVQYENGDGECCDEYVKCLPGTFILDVTSTN